MKLLPKEFIDKILSEVKSLIENYKAPINRLLIPISWLENSDVYESIIPLYKDNENPRIYGIPFDIVDIPGLIALTTPTFQIPVARKEKKNSFSEWDIYFFERYGI